jgi:2-keto-4-pentenoate hydratase/2-oxohepta-3-ene-1,7-dioic acid hydratase in catechol pathway
MLKGRAFWKGREWSVEALENGLRLLPSGPVVPLSEALLLPPSTPSKIVCVGRNYREHAKELGNPMPERPLLFLKPPSSVLAHGGAIRLPRDSNQVEYEGEIAVVMGRLCRNLGPEEDPLAFVEGVTPLNDVTARDLQRLDVQFTRAKSFDTFCPFGPFVAPLGNLDTLGVRTFLNGALVQEGFARDMAFSIPDLVRYAARVMTLFPGDVIATGTPAGVGRLTAGDVVEVEVDGVRLKNTVELGP